MTQNRASNPIAVLVIILVNVLVFIATSLDRNILYHLDLVPARFTDEPWVMLTSLFAHADFFHILSNMITLYFFGTYLTMVVGEIRFLVTYFIGGLAGNALYMLYALYAPWVDPGNQYIGAIGASGAVFAIGGALAILRPNLKVLLFFIIPMPLWVAIIGGFVLLTLMSAGLNIAWEAHLGGLVVGLIAGYFFKKRERHLYLF